MPPLAYYFSVFPALSETFVRFQVVASERLGLSFLLVANRPPTPPQMPPGGEILAARTRYLTPVRPLGYLLANARTWNRRPGPYVRGLKEAWRLAGGAPQQLAANLAHLAGAAHLREVLASHDVRHVHVHYAFGAADVALFLSLISDIPYSLSLHGSDVLLDNPLLAAKLAGAAFLVSNCRYHIQYLRQRFPFLAGRRFYLVRGGLDFTAPDWCQPRSPAPLPPLRLLNVARLSPVKAQDVLLRACGLLAREGVPLECRLVGEGPERPRLAGLIHSLGLAGRVALWGARSLDEVARLYDWCHVAVLSSRSEGTPMTVMEAMAKARPVVAPRLTALPEMVAPGHTGFLFAPGDVADLAAKLRTFHAHPQLIGEMGEAGRIRARQLFDLAPNAQTFVNVLAQEVPALRLTPTTKVPHV